MIFKGGGFVMDIYQGCGRGIFQVACVWDLQLSHDDEVIFAFYLRFLGAEWIVVEHIMISP